MKKFPAVKIVILLISLLLLGCVAIGMFNQNQAEDSTTSPAADEPDATPKPFSLEDLSGILAFHTSRCAGESSCQHIGIASLDGATTRMITSHSVGMAMFPVWSPDGRYIAYPFFEMEKGFYNEIRLFDFTDRSETTITSEPIYGTIDSLTWAPDNDNLVYARTDDSDDSELFLVDINAQEIVNLSNSPEFLDQNPTWSPGGEVIAFDSDRGGSFDIWTISPDGDELVNLTGGDGDTYREIKPSWSPEGHQIAFYRYKNASASLWLMDADSSGQRELLDLGNSEYAQTPVWSPNGVWIGLIARGNPVSTVWLIKPSTGEILQASAEPGRYWNLSWAPNSSAVAYLENIQKTGIPLVHLHAVDGSYHDAWEAPLRIYNLIWSPVGTQP